VTAPLRVLINGTESDQLSVLDRGLHYGDGVFRSLRVEQGAPCDWLRHLGRLCDDARRIELKLPDADVLTAQAMQLCADQLRAVLKIILTRGPAGRGYQTVEAETSRILLLYPMPEHPASYRKTGIQVRICATRLAQNPRLAGIKHLNRLEQVLARAEWSDPEIMEGLMLDTDDRLVEGVSSNLFLVRDGELLTPDLSRCGIAGVTREMILDASPAYTKTVRVLDLTMRDLLTADECFVCNSVIGILPVTQLENKRWDVGTMTRKIQQSFGDACPPAA
jgi:4-amino-4-deoxychorismate lyase